MAEYLSEFVTNLAMPPAVRPVPHQFAMGDNNAYTFTALLCDARNPDAELMAGTVSGSLLRPDGTTVALGGTKGAAVRRVNLDGGGMCNATPCSVTLPQACFAYPGRVTLVITLVDGTTITQALAVSAVVARTSTDAVVDPGDLVPDVDELQAIATELTAAVGGAVRFDEAQTLTDAQKAQARANIGAGEGGGGTVTGAVRYDTAQTLTDAEKTQAQTNIGAAAVSAITSLSADITALETQKAVRYDAAQFLTDAQKAQARTNVGAAGAAETTAAIQTEAAARDQAIADKAVRYDTAQALTAAQQIQARGNIGAAGEADFEAVTGYIPMGGQDGSSTAARGVTVTRVGQRFSFSRTAPSQYGAAVYCLLPYIDGANASSAPPTTWCGDATLALKAGHRYRMKARLVSGTFPADSGRITISARNEAADTLGDGAVINLLTGVMAVDFTFTGQRFAITAFITKEYYSETPIVIDLVLEELPDQVISGANPVISASPGSSYVCSESYVETLSFTPSAVGICSVRFVSGTTATVLTLPNTVKMPDWWTGVEASRTYEISIADGVYGAVTSWA